MSTVDWDDAMSEDARELVGQFDDADLTKAGALVDDAHRSLNTAAKLYAAAGHSYTASVLEVAGINVDMARSHESEVA